MKKLIVVLLVALWVPLMALAVFAETIEGSIQGYRCVTEGKVCPIGQEDPVAAIETAFVVLTEGKAYYIVTNMDRAILSRHINARVRVKGKVNSKYNSIEVDSFEVFDNGKWKTTWSPKMEKDWMDSLN